MIKKIVIGAVVIIVALIVLGGNKKQKQDPVTITPPSSQTRSFYMGFSGWPPAFDQSAIQKSYDLMKANSDIQLVHMDNGIPWTAMAEHKDIPSRITKDWDFIKNNIKEQKRVIAITPLNFERSGLALENNDTGDNQPLPQDWKQAKLNDIKTKEAYLAYAQKTIDYWKPDYFAIGIEVNIAANKNQEVWNQYVDLHQYVYTELKKQHPNLPIFASIQLEHFKGLADESKGKTELQKTEVKKLLQYSDIASLSVYPYTVKGQAFPDTYFDDIRSFGKPLAISETGWPSQNFSIYIFPVKGSEKAQAEYLEQVLNLANKKQFVFVINWVNVDYVKLWDKFPSGPTKELGKSWIYNGLWDENFRAKPALTVWQNYLKLSHK